MTGKYLSFTVRLGFEFFGLELSGAACYSVMPSTSLDELIKEHKLTTSNTLKEILSILKFTLVTNPVVERSFLRAIFVFC